VKIKSNTWGYKVQTPMRKGGWRKRERWEGLKEFHQLFLEFANIQNYSYSTSTSVTNICNCIVVSHSVYSQGGGCTEIIRQQKSVAFIAFIVP
jgi:hypothetical protein